MRRFIIIALLLSSSFTVYAQSNFNGYVPFGNKYITGDVENIVGPECESNCWDGLENTEICPKGTACTVFSIELESGNSTDNFNCGPVYQDRYMWGALGSLFNSYSINFYCDGSYPLIFNTQPGDVSHFRIGYVERKLDDYNINFSYVITWLVIITFILGFDLLRKLFTRHA